MVGTRSTRNKGKEPTREPLRERSLSYDDPNALGEEGENQAARQETGKLSIGAKDIARYLEINRSIDWNENTGPQSVGAGKQRTASVLQRRGDVSQSACSRCEQGNRVFGSCVAAPVISGYAFQRGACANCIWDGKERSCSLRGENMLLDSTSVLQFTGDGFNLRQAILEEAWIDGDDNQLEPPAPMEMEVYVDPENEVDAPEVSSEKDDKASSDKNDDKASSDKENADVATFLAEIKPDSSFARIGISQHGPRCRFDGVELKFPISREIWESERRLLKARSDLAHFVAIIDARLFDMGHGRSDAVFWEREARRLTRMFATGIRRKRGRTASSRRPSLTPPPKIVVSEAVTSSSQLMPHPTPQTEPQRTGETIQALTEPPQPPLPSTNTEVTRTEAKPHTPPTIVTSSGNRRVWDRPQTPENKHNDKESPAFGPVHVQEDFENLHGTVEQITAVMGGPKAPAEEPAPTCVDPDEEERESCKQSADPGPAPAATEPVRAKFTDHEERAATELRRPFWTLRRPRPKDLDEGPPPIVSKRFRSERHGDRASE